MVKADRARSGLEVVFFDNRDALLRFLRAVGEKDAAEDLLQELWLRASSASTGPISDPLAYLYRMANNLALDRRRSELRRKKREEEWTASSLGSRSEASDYHSAERSVVAREQLRSAEIALADLGERTDQIFRRFRLDGISQCQIAEELGISLSAVEKHLQKAYRVLLQIRRQSDAD